MPLVPGMQFTLSGDVLDGQNNPHPHQIITTVTDLTKVIDGVRSMVIQDVDVQDSVIIESEIFFVAQDRKGTVWTLGEYPEEYVNGQLDGAPSTWLSGVDGAHAGIAMLAKPKVGTPTYLQGLAPTVGFKDCATVLRIANRQCVTSGCYHDILVTDEFAPLDPTGGHQRKLYAAGVGAIKVGAAGGIDPETLQLTKAGPLCKADFAAVRQQALAQDVRGYTVAADVYGGSPHAKDTLDAKTC
jgi:hypothetical protein